MTEEDIGQREGQSAVETIKNSIYRAAAEEVSLNYGSKLEDRPEEEQRQFLNDAKTSVNAAWPLIKEILTASIIRDNADPFIGLATTMQLIDEIGDRAKVAHANGEKWPKTNELSGPGSGVTTMKLLDELKYRVHNADNLGDAWPHFKTVDGGFSVRTSDVEVVEESTEPNKVTVEPGELTMRMAKPPNEGDN